MDLITYIPYMKFRKSHIQTEKPTNGKNNKEILQITKK